MFRKKSAARFSKLGFQGEMLQFLEEEEMDIGWKSTIYRVPRGLMSWAMPAGTNSLATVDNLSRWGRPVNPECDMPGCDSVCTLRHILSACGKSLDRFKYRHNSILTHFAKKISDNKKAGMTVYADLQGWKINGGTIPAHLAQTEQRPDLVVIDESLMPSRVYLLELTCVWDSGTSFQAAMDRKMERYELLALDIEEKGYSVFNSVSVFEPQVLF